MANTERDITIEIRTKTNKALKDIKTLNSEIDKLKKSNQNFKKTAQDVKQLSRSFAQLATHVSKLAIIYGTFTGLNNTVRTFADFEQSLKRLQVVSGATDSELKDLEKTARNLGSTTQYTASQVSDGLNAMAMAGLSVKQQMAGIGSVLDIASVGLISIEDSSLMAVKAMTGFNLKATDMGRISDVMVTGATKSAQTITELGSAYEKVASVATSYNVSIEDTTAALELLANAGRKGSEAGTQLKIIMSRLAGNKEALKYINALGISMYDANGKLKPFYEQLKELKKALSGLDEQSRNIRLSQIAGEEGKSSLIVLLKNLDQYKTKIQELNGSYGVAHEKAKQMMDTLIGGWKTLQSSLQELALKIGDTLTPVLVELMSDATDFVRSLSKEDVKAFSQELVNLITFGKETTTMLVQAVGAITSFTASFEKSTDVNATYLVGIGLLVYKLKSLRTALISVTASNPELAALAALLIGVSYAFDQWQQEIDKLNSATDESKKSLKIYGDLIDKIFIHPESFKNEKQVSESIKKVDDAIEHSTKALRGYKAMREKIKNQIWISDEDEKAIKSLDGYIAESTKLLESEKEGKKKLIGIGKNLREALLKEESARKRINTISKNSLPLLKEEQAAIDKSIKQYKSREDNLKNALVSMYNKEAKYIDDIKKLEDKKIKIYKKYSDMRLSLKNSLDAKIFDLQNKGMLDIVKYNNAQLRAESQLSKAKEAMARGNLKMSETYLAEYDRLISISAGEEISHRSKVRVYNSKSHRMELKDIKIVDATRSQTLAKAVSEERTSTNIKLALSKLRENAEIKAVNSEIDGKRTALSLQKAQIILQKQMVELLAQLISKGKHAKIHVDFTDYNNAVRNADKQLEALTNQKRNAKIKPILDKVKYENDAKKLTKKVIKQDIDLDEKGGFTKFEVFKNGVKKDLLHQKIDVSVDDNDFKVFKTTVKQPTVTPVKANTSSADTAISKLRSYAQKPMYTTLYVRTVHTRSNGGLIPRFNQGGSTLDNGIGHTPKSGKLSGYGGGDKIKALLEAGEFIVRKEAVRALGLDRLYQINQGRLPRYQNGGVVDIPRFNSGGVISNPTTKSSVDLNINMGGNTFKANTTEDVATSLAEFLQRSNF